MECFWKGFFLVCVMANTSLTGAMDADTVRQLINEDPALKSAQVGISIKAKDAPELSVNAEKRFIPASVTKLVTTALALDELGGEFQFITKAAMDGTLKGGILEGNLYLIGGGDPSLNQRGIESLASQVAASGIRVVKGSVFADVSLFGSETFPTDLEWADLQEGYGAEISPLSFNDNYVTVVVNLATGELHCREQLPYCSIEGSVDRAEEGSPLKYKREFLANRVEVYGGLGKGEGVEEIKIAVHKPSEYARQAWIKALSDVGVQIHFGDEPGGDRTFLASLASPTLANLLREVNHQSNNLYAETILRYIAKRRYPDLSFEEAESRVLQEYLHKLGVERSEFVLREGAGLSRHNLLTPKIVVTLLKRKVESPEGSDFLNVLPVAGQDGTLQKRFSELNAGLVIKAKTGGMEGVTNLAGVAESSAGIRILFCIFVNGSTKTYKETAASLDALLLKILNSYGENSANTRAGNPEAPATLGKAAMTMPPA
ncbi:D-alanyl-D-alanine carboxypeptidase/D-alanyl-D-alanine-endopeptidase [Estrella lausannensis]|uniref:D-alanyl-D-alanine carboxypeptidase n=1 Tax=Estrella lausannensis TaxID=483423 RepID=A0A0H5DPC2_9BACT|nr:D-alanyl-D-alanine carboxypeptidase/D-alanyl-D-alanine-endopeptidase [Estrella lausannensis]CRX38257.1 D-alanyl-D-alanine carboxypeptidase [Estrella lausannensis]